MKQLELYDTFSIKFNIDEKKKEMIISDSGGIRKDYSLICEVNATHAGTLINNRIYPPESMKKGLKSWTKPYKKPVLVDHNDSSDPIGRVIKARYVKTPKGEIDEYKPVLKQSDGYGYQRLTIKITDPAAVQKILDGRYETVSVRMSTNHAFCSICNADWSDGPCEHAPGKHYDKKLAYITTGDLMYREMSFVNAPADEFAGVKEAILKENDALDKEPVGISLYANNDEEKVLLGLGSKDDVNLYNLLDNETEEGDEVILYLLDKSSKVAKDNKEEDVKLEELTKDQLRDLDTVKALIEEEVAKFKGDAKKKEDECDERIKKLVEEHEKNNKDVDCDKIKEELNKLKEEKDLAVSNFKAKEKELADEIVKKEEDRKRLLDENIKLNTELHRVVAERMYDLKRTLRKPDVVNVKTPDEHNKKVEEFAQRSVDSLKDQISDLLLEQELFISTGLKGEIVENPGVSQIDKTNEVEPDKTKKPETKKDKLIRLFSKS